MTRILLAQFTICMSAAVVGCATSPVSDPQKTKETMSTAGGSPEPKAELEWPEDSLFRRPKTDKDIDFIGLDQAAAEALAEKRGMVHRVVSLDGKGITHYLNYCPGRINFYIEKRKVVKTTRG